MKRFMLAALTGAVLTAGLTANSVLVSGPDDPRRNSPPFTLNGIEFSLGNPGDHAAGGGSPVAVVTASNPGKVAAEAVLRIQMFATRPEEMYSRMASAPELTWTRDLLVRLSPGEARTNEIDTGARVAAESRVAFQLSKGDARIAASDLRDALGSAPAPVPAEVDSPRVAASEGAQFFRSFFSNRARRDGAATVVSQSDPALRAAR